MWLISSPVFLKGKIGCGRFQEMSLHHWMLIVFNYCPLCALVLCERSVFKYLHISREVSHVTLGHVIDIWVSNVSTHHVWLVTWESHWIVVFDSVNIGCVHIWSCLHCGVSRTPKLTPLVSFPEVSFAILNTNQFFEHWRMWHMKIFEVVYTCIISGGSRISQSRQNVCRKLHEIKEFNWGNVCAFPLSDSPLITRWFYLACTNSSGGGGSRNAKSFSRFIFSVIKGHICSDTLLSLVVMF